MVNLFLSLLFVCVREISAPQTFFASLIHCHQSAKLCGENGYNKEARLPPTHPPHSHLYNYCCWIWTGMVVIHIEEA